MMSANVMRNFYKLMHKRGGLTDRELDYLLSVTQEYTLVEHTANALIHIVNTAK
jgi:beta-xylosidase